MKKIYFLFITIIVVAISIVFGNIFFLTSNIVYLPEEDLGYNINQYDVDIVVKDDRKLEIQEKIQVDFTETSHGIYRYIPTSQNISYYNKNGEFQSKNYKNRIKI